MRELLTIGRFAELTDLSPKVLRKLDERGLLSPAFVDPDTHYRYYAYAQLRPANLIRVCRQFELPAEEIRALLESPDPADLRRHLERHRARVTHRIAEQARILDLLEQELGRARSPLAYEIAVKDVPAILVASARGTSARKHPHDPMDLEHELGRVARAVHAHLEQEGVEATGPPVILYHTSPQESGVVAFEVCWPVTRPVTQTAEIRCVELPASLQAFTIHKGPYETIWNAYAELGVWADEEGYTVVGPAREIGLVSPHHTADPHEWVTEIALPVARAS